MQNATRNLKRAPNSASFGGKAAFVGYGAVVTGMGGAVAHLKGIALNVRLVWGRNGGAHAETLGRGANRPGDSAHVFFFNF